MTTVLSKLTSCRESNLITRMKAANYARRKPIRKCKQKHPYKNKSNGKKKQVVSNVPKSGERQKGVFSRESIVLPSVKVDTKSPERNPDHTKLVKNTNSSLSYFEDLSSRLEFVKQWINSPSKMVLRANKEDMSTNPKCLDAIYSEETIKQNFNAEPLRYTKIVKTIPKCISRKPYALMSPCGTHEESGSNPPTFTKKTVKSANEEESYLYIESDSSSQKTYSLSGKINRSSHRVENLKTKTNVSTRKDNHSKTPITTRRDCKYPQLNTNLENRNLVENATGAILIKHIDLTTKIDKNSSGGPNDQQELAAFPNNKTGNAAKYSLNKSNKNGNISTMKSYSDKSNYINDWIQKGLESTDPLESKDHRIIENICVDKARDSCDSQNKQGSISSSDRKKSSLAKDKIHPMKNNISKNFNKKLSQTEMLKNVHLLQSNPSPNEHNRLFGPKSISSRDKHSKNLQEVKFNPIGNKKSIPPTVRNSSLTDNLNNLKEIDTRVTRKEDKSCQQKDNKKNISNRKSSNDTQVIKCSPTQPKSTVSSTHRKNATSSSISDKFKIALQKTEKDTRSINTIVTKETKHPSSQHTNRILSRQEAQCQNNSKKTEKTKSLSENKEIILRCKTRNHELNAEKKAINTPRNKKKYESAKKQSIHATGSYTNAYENAPLRNAKMLQRESCSVNPSKLTGKARMPEEGSYANISSKNTKNERTLRVSSSTTSTKNAEEAEIAEEKSSLLIALKNTESMKVLENSSSLGKNVNNLNQQLEKSKKKNKDKKRTFTNLPVRQVQRAWNLRKRKITDKLVNVHGSKPDTSKKSEEMKCTTQSLSDKRNNRPGNRCYKDKEVEIACSSSGKNCPADAIESTNNKKGKTEKNGKPCRNRKGISLEKEEIRESKTEKEETSSANVTLKSECTFMGTT